MHPLIGWALAGIGIAIGTVRFGWRGFALGVSAVVFWLLLQFSATLRTLRAASRASVGSVANAVMLHARLRKGMRLAQVIQLARSLGQSGAPERDCFVWTDAGGDRVELRFDNAGRLASWALVRAAAPCLRSDSGPGALP